MSMTRFKKVLGVAAVATALGSIAGPTMAANYPDFTIDESSVPGTGGLGSSSVVADRLNGLYTEQFTPTFTSATTGTFTSTARFSISAYYQNDVLVPALLGCNVGTFCYNLFADFQATGSFSIDDNGTAGDPSDDVITFTGDTAAVQLYLDPDQNSFTANTLLASSNTLISGDGSIDLGDNSTGDFEIIFGGVTLTDPAGKAFFVAPNPFHIIVDINGNFTENPLVPGTTVSGSANAFFAAVPEPGSLALVGLALLGVGAVRRRKA